MTDFVSLLPSNATPLEKRVERTLGERLDALNLDYQLYNPQTCPENMLPFLAWVFDLPDWDNDLPLSVRRNLVAAAPYIKAHCGTVAAVEAALGALLIRTQFIEWFNQQPLGNRGTFIVRAYASSRFGNSAILDDKLIAHIKALISHAKPATRHFDFQIGIETGTQMRASVAAVPPIKQNLYQLNATPNKSAVVPLRASSATTKPIRVTTLDMRLAA